MRPSQTDAGAISPEPRSVRSQSLLLRTSARRAVLRRAPAHRALFDASPDAALVFDAQSGALLDCNRAARALCGEAALGGLRLSSLLPSGERPDTWRATLKTAAGPTLAELRAAPLLHDGRPALLVSVRDISEQARLETERRELQERLRRSQRMEAVSRLVAGLAHDLKNLQTIVSVNLDFLGDGSPELRQIRDANRRGTAMLGSLLRLGRGAATKAERIDPAALLQEVVWLLGRLLGERHRAVVAPAAECPLVCADPDQLSQVLLNLLLNARDAMPDGGDILMSCEALDLDEEFLFRGGALPAGRYACITVRDAGVGMSAEVLERLFEPFFTTKPVGHGTGLGLATSLGIVRDAGGTVLVESRPGQGSVFRVLLPVAE